MNRRLNYAVALLLCALSFASTAHARRYDPETGLIYCRNRMYDPNLGRFASRDPLRYYDGLNQYTYVRNSPAKYGDPLGLKPHEFKEGTMDFQSTNPEGYIAFTFNATITFTPKKDVCKCARIVWIQWMDGGLDNPKTGGKEHPYYNFNPFNKRHASANKQWVAEPLGDYTADLGQTGSSPDTSDGSQRTGTPATLKDTPRRREKTAWQSCVQCFDDKRWMGCVSWGFNPIDDDNAEVTGPTYSDSPDPKAPLPAQFGPGK